MINVNNVAVCWWCSGHCNITILRGPGFDSRTRQEKEVPIHAVHLLSFLRRSDPPSGDNLALASHPRMGQNHMSIMYALDSLMQILERDTLAFFEISNFVQLKWNMQSAFSRKNGNINLLRSIWSRHILPYFCYFYKSERTIIPKWSHNCTDNMYIAIAAHGQWHNVNSKLPRDP